MRMAWNTKAIADAIKFYIENRDAIRKKGNNAFNVVQDFSPRKFLEIWKHYIWKCSSKECTTIFK